ncbi:hypothetical protein EGW08_018609, partial [Elysia chlorotica]
MLIKEYRISLPMSVEEYRIAQLYMIQRKSREESHGTESGVEIIENKPYSNGPGGSGQYTYKIYHIGSHLPGWFRAILPKSALRVEEEAWNAYPYTKTRFKCPFIEKFLLEVETRYIDDAGDQDGVFTLTKSEKAQTTVDHIDIVKDSVTGGDYKKEEDPKLFVSAKTGRGPLTDNWRKEYGQAMKAGLGGKEVMTAYKLCRVEFKYWGMQNKIERFIHDVALRKTMLRAHRQAWAWQDEYHGLTLDDIRELERQTQLALAEKMAAAAAAAAAAGEGGVSPTTTTTASTTSPTTTTPIDADADNVDNFGSSSSSTSEPFPSSPASSSSAFSSSNRHQHQQRLLQQQGQVAYTDSVFFSKSFCVLPCYKCHCVAHSQDSNSMLYLSAAFLFPLPLHPLLNTPEPQFDKRVEHFRQMYSVDSSLPTTDSSSAAQPACPTQILFLVLHGGNILDSNQESAIRRCDLTNLRATFDSIMRAHYPLAASQVIFRLVSCPYLCSEALSVLSRLSPFNCESHPGAAAAGKDASLTRNQQFVPLGAIALFATAGPEYQEHVNTMVVTANQVYNDFLQSDEGRGFTGQVCLLADALGSLLAYDALAPFSASLTRHGSRYGSRESMESSAIGPCSDPVQGQGHPLPPGTRQHHLSCDGGGGGGGARTGDWRDKDFLRRTSSGSHYEGGIAKFDFDVTDVFMCGAPLGMVLAYRRAQKLQENSGRSFFLRPACHQVYNLFHSNDPTAVRLEPLLNEKFSLVPPVSVCRYSKFPLGDGEPVHVVETIQSRLKLFTQQLSEREGATSKSLQRQASFTSVCSTSSGLGDNTVSCITNVTRNWWGAKRMDYVLYCPEALHSFPTNALPHLFHSSFWESTDVAAFILRQILKQNEAAFEPGKGINRDTMSSFKIKTPREKWLKRKTTIKVRNLQPNHRANDVIALEDSAQVISAKFMYGSLDITSLSGEKVDVHIMKQPPTGDWVLVGTDQTDSHGRLIYTIPAEHRLSQGMYPVKLIVRGDHTSVDMYLAVLPPKTETVVFSIDGSFTASVSIMGKDPKVRAGAVDVVRQWSDLGYLILYVSARPDLQHRKVVAWLAQHNFPHGIVAFGDGLSKDPLKQKFNYIRSLQTEAQIQLRAAYGSNKDINFYRELGLHAHQIFIVGKASKKQHSQAQILCDGYSAHLSQLMSPGFTRPASGNARMFLRKSNFRLSSRDSSAQREGKKLARRAVSHPAPPTYSADGFTTFQTGDAPTTKIVVEDFSTVAGSTGRGREPRLNL